MNQSYSQVVYENEEDRQLARILSVLIWASWGIYLFVISTGLYYNDWKVIIGTLIGCVLLIVPLALLKRRHLRASSLSVVLIEIGIVTAIATVGQGIRDLAIVAFPIIFIFAGLTLSRKFFRLCVGLTLAAVCWLVLGDAYGWFVTQPFNEKWSNWFYLIGGILILLIAALAVDLLATNMRKSLELARQEITQRKDMEESLALTQFCVDQASIGIVRTDAQAKFVSANDYMCQMLGYTADEIVNLHVYDIDPNFPFEKWKAHRQQLRSKRSDRHETIHRRKDGTTFPVEITNSYVELKGESFSFSFVQDITERKRAEEQLRYLGTHDALTGIYNRAFFEAELVRLDHSREFPVSVIIADVDQLKVANDSLGHAAGDEILRQTTNVLCSVFRAGDMLARIGGDEFAVLLPATNSTTAEQIVFRVKERLAVHNTEHPDFPTQLSLGVATAEKHNLTEVFVLADQRMYADKAIHRSNAYGTADSIMPKEVHDANPN